MENRENVECVFSLAMASYKTPKIQPPSQVKGGHIYSRALLTHGTWWSLGNMTLHVQSTKGSGARSMVFDFSRCQGSTGALQF